MDNDTDETGGANTHTEGVQPPPGSEAGTRSNDADGNGADGGEADEVRSGGANGTDTSTTGDERVVSFAKAKAAIIAVTKAKAAMQPYIDKVREREPGWDRFSVLAQAAVIAEQYGVNKTDFRAWTGGELKMLGAGSAQKKPKPDKEVRSEQGYAVRFEQAKALLQEHIDKFAEGEINEPSLIAQATDIARRCNVAVRNLCNEARLAVAKVKVKNRPLPPTPADAAAAITKMPNPSPAPAPQPLAEALDQIVRLIELRIVCPPEATWAVALWVAATWGVRGPDEVGGPDLFPRLGIRSATTKCGKSLLLEIVMYMSATPLAAENVTASAVFRATEKYRPSWMLDEADTFMRGSDELRGVMNSGFVRRGSVARSVEVSARDANGHLVKTFELKSFSTFSPMAYAGIGRQRDTIETRTVRVVLKRQKAPRARSKRLRYAELLKARNIVCAHLHAYGDAMAAAMAERADDDDFPDVVDDRDADNWESLIAVAKLAGQEWPDRARRAMLLLCTGIEAAGQTSAAERMLGDVQDFVQEKRRNAVKEYIEWRKKGRPLIRAGTSARGAMRPSPAEQVREGDAHQSPPPPRPRIYSFIVSNDLASALMGIDDSPIAASRDLAEAKLKIATVMRSFGIRPRRQREDGSQTRGYDVCEFRPVWRSYRVSHP